MNETIELKAARKEVRELKAASADARKTRGKDEPETESERDAQVAWYDPCQVVLQKVCRVRQAMGARHDIIEIGNTS